MASAAIGLSNVPGERAAGDGAGGQAQSSGGRRKERRSSAAAVLERGRGGARRRAVQWKAPRGIVGRRESMKARAGTEDLEAAIGSWLHTHATDESNARPRVTWGVALQPGARRRALISQRACSTPPSRDD
jgi:hypothetical protein